ncbi:hypothetical protein [Micromonospora inositola]|uniref:Secreted protein n=1 Tax=Micromonospora inositola TaxID=47865 RepID=A0A1C5I542_9ACTN|nr:hypothetical protein [Micromonospora inositola]SCG53317.1 hypothetical protein GA0070613_2265 [Micromonospora inositola]
MRSTPAAAAAVAALLAVLSGCTSTDPTVAAPSPTAAATPTAVASPITATPATPTTATTPGAPATAARVLLVRTGGIAGTRETVTVEPDGRWARTDRAGSTRNGRLGPTDLDRLRQLLADPRLATEATAPADPGDCADAFAYRLTVNTRTTGYVDCDTGPDRPPATAAVVALLTRVTS